MSQQEEQTTKSMGMSAPLEGIPLPDLENVPDYEFGFWEGARDHELRIQQCSGCERLRHLPTPMCPFCHSLKYDWTKMSGRGKVYSYIIVRHPAHQAIRDKEQTPYNVCLIELVEQKGLRVISNILNIPPEDIYIDMPVEVTFMPTTDEPSVVLPLFVPAHTQ